MSPTTNSIFVLFSFDSLNRLSWKLSIELFLHIKVNLNIFSNSDDKLENVWRGDWRTVWAGLKFSADFSYNRQFVGNLIRQLKQMCLTRVDSINHFTKLHFCTEQSIIICTHQLVLDKSLFVVHTELTVSVRFRRTATKLLHVNTTFHSCHFTTHLLPPI